MSETADIIGWLIKQDVETVRGWLYEVWEGTRSVPDDFSWPHLLKAIEVSAKTGKYPSNPPYPDLAWGRLTLELYHYVLDTLDEPTRRYLEVDLMYLKLWFIKHYGSVEDDELLDVSQFVPWFFKELPFSREEIEKRLTHKEVFDLEESSKRRYIKEKLTVLRLLSEKGLLSPDEELKRWLALENKLLKPDYIFTKEQE